MHQGVPLTNLLTVIFVVFDWIIQLEQRNESLNIQVWTGFEQITNVRPEQRSTHRNAAWQNAWK